MNTIEKLKQQAVEIEKQRNAIFEQIKPLQEKNAILFNEQKKINEKITIETLKTNLTLQEKFDFLMYENGISSDMIRYNEANKFILDFGLYMSGYCKFSEQRSVSVFIYYRDKEANKKSISSLYEIIPLFKPMNEKGDKIFQFFCKDQNIVVHSNGTFSINGNTLYNSDKNFSTLEDLFDYFVENYECCDEDEYQNRHTDE